MTFVIVAIVMVVLTIGIVGEGIWFLVPRLNAAVGGSKDQVPVILFRIEDFKKLNLQ
ncbi:MAG: hypothetical protein HYS43_02015 [Candidatus Liptonbacteria bacterium]|nr:hypothetical protein [Candidatus Liptonbacteria bacterium]